MSKIILSECDDICSAWFNSEYSVEVEEIVSYFHDAMLLIQEKYGSEYKYVKFQEEKVLVGDSYQYLFQFLFNINAKKISKEAALDDLQYQIQELKDNIKYSESALEYHKNAIPAYKKELKDVQKKYDKLIKEIKHDSLEK